MKWLKVFSVFFILHALAWVGGHWYKSANPEQVLVVADTSFALKDQYPEMERWIENFSSDNRYREIIVGTDKAFIGDLADIKSIDSIFRVSFGRSNADSLRRYDSQQVDERIFLSDGDFNAPGWTQVDFPE